MRRLLRGHWYFSIVGNIIKASWNEEVCVKKKKFGKFFSNIRESLIGQ